MKKWLVVSFVVFLSACGSSLKGTYTDDTGDSSLTFVSGGKVDVHELGDTVEMNYKVDGNQLKISAAGQPPEILTIRKDGSIAGAEGVILTKKR